MQQEEPNKYVKAVSYTHLDVYKRQAVLTLGRVSGEGCDRRVEDFLLKENELALLKQVSAAYRAAGKKLVVVLNICSPVETASWTGLADAVVCAFQPGREVGNCITDILTGEVNPSGKLPMTLSLIHI